MLTQQLVNARITLNPEILGGKAIIRGTRVSVNLVVDFSSNGASVDQIVEDYPELTREDVEAALAFAAQCAARTEVRPW